MRRRVRFSYSYFFVIVLVPVFVCVFVLVLVFDVYDGGVHFPAVRNLRTVKRVLPPT